MRAGMQREVLADVARVDGDARVLADEVALAVGDLDVAEDRVQHADARDGRLAPGGVLQRVAEILRDVFQRPDVEVRGCVLDGMLQLGGRVNTHAARFLCSCFAGSASEDDALEQRVAHHAVPPVRAAGDLAARVHACERRLGVARRSRGRRSGSGGRGT